MNTEHTFWSSSKINSAYNFYRHLKTVLYRSLAGAELEALPSRLAWKALYKLS